MPWIDWYNSLAKPSWTPAPATIGLIWSILYPIIAVSFGFVFVQAVRKKLPWQVTLPFGINLVTNLLFMPIFSGMRNVPLAAMDILIVWATIIWSVVAVWPRQRWVAIAQGPYFVWVSIATVLQLSITVMNWRTANVHIRYAEERVRVAELEFEKSIKAWRINPDAISELEIERLGLVAENRHPEETGASEISPVRETFPG